MSRKYEGPLALLTLEERGKLGGIRGSERLTPEQREQRSSLAGKACFEQRGREFYVRLAMKRWGKKVDLNDSKTQIGKTPKRPPGPGPVALARRRDKARADALRREDQAWAKDFILRGSVRGVPITRPSAAAAAAETEAGGQAGGDGVG